MAYAVTALKYYIIYILFMIELEITVFVTERLSFNFYYYYFEGKKKKTFSLCRKHREKS